MRNTYAPPEGGFPVTNNGFNREFRDRFETTVQAPAGKLADMIDRLNSLDTEIMSRHTAEAA